jgi:hypothetical protein
MNNSLTKEQVTNFFKARWKPLAAVGIVLFMLFITLLIPGKSKNATNTIPTNRGSVNGSSGTNNLTNKTANPLDLLFGTGKSRQTQNQKVETSVVKPPPDAINAKTSVSSITKVLQNGSKEVQKVTANSIFSTAQGTINPNASIAQDLASNTHADNITIAFLNPDGSTFTYIPPGTPPDDVRWARYTNENDKYAINYPFNWQFVYSFNNGHEGVALYPPGVDLNDSNSPFIGFGVSDAFHLPAVGNSTGAYVTPIVVDGIAGDLYTNGSLGNSYVASVLPDSGRYFGLGSKISSTTFIYVYYYMLHSLTFNVQ